MCRWNSPRSSWYCLAAGLDAVVADALDRLRSSLARCTSFGILLARIVRHQLRLDRLAGQIDVAHVDLVVDRLRRGVAAIGVVDDEQAAGWVRQQHRPMVEQAVGVVHLDRLGPLVAVEPAGERQPVRAGVACCSGCRTSGDRSARRGPCRRCRSSDRRSAVRFSNAGPDRLRRRAPARLCRACGSSAAGWMQLAVLSGRRRGRSGRSRAGCRRRRRGRRSPCPTSRGLLRRRSRAGPWDRRRWRDGPRSGNWCDGRRLESFPEAVVLFGFLHAFAFPNP